MPIPTYYAQGQDMTDVNAAIEEWLRKANQPNAFRTGVQGAQSMLDNPLNYLRPPGMYLPVQPGGPSIKAAGRMTGDAVGSVLDALAPDYALTNTTAMKTGSPAPLEQPRDGMEFQKMLGDVGESVPRMVTTGALLAIPGAGIPLAMAKEGLETYGDTGQVAPSVISAAAIPVGGAGMSAGARLGNRAFLRSVLPTAEKLAGEQAFGPAVGKVFQTIVDPAQATGLAASRFLGGVAGGTASTEAVRQAQNFATGQGFQMPTAGNLVTDAATNLMFAAPLAKSVFGGHEVVTPGTEAPAGDPSAPFGTLQMEASKIVTKAQGLRTKAAQEQAAYDASRGERIGQAHADILSTFEAGGDPLPAIAALKQHWDEAKPTPTPQAGLTFIQAASEEANSTGIPDEAFQRIVAGVQGRYADHFKADPSMPGPETLNELVKRGLLPRVTKEWVSRNFGDAVDQMLGDYEGAKANLINRITAHYEERLPSALEAMRAQPVQEGLSRQALNAQTEADKDATYIQALLKLASNMKGKVAPDGKTSLLSALWQRDMEMSSATQGSQLSASSTAWSKYDAWKGALIKLADTYDPQTRQGQFLPTKRMSDGSMLELPAQKVSLEDLVQREGGTTNGKYTFDVTPTRKMNRSGSSSALRDAVEFVNEKFRPTDQTEEDISNLSDPEKFIEARKGMIKSNVDDELLSEDALGKEADAEGLTGEERQAYIDTNSQPNALGVDLGKTNQESYYDVALHLMNKVDKLTNAELWDKYGGEQLFGKGAKSPGKFQLFKDAILARMESEMDDTGQLSVAQQKFYDNWRANAAQKTGEAPKAMKTWEERRAQFRHAQRLYWGTGNPVDMKDLFMTMLDDKPKYQQMLRAQKPQSAESASGTEANAAPAGESFITHANVQSPYFDAIRLGRSYARQLGLPNDVADEFAVTLGKAVLAFDETAGYTDLVTEKGNTMGLSSYSKQLGGPVAAVNLQAIQNRTKDAMGAIIKVLQTTSHELAHNYSDHVPTTMSGYRQQRADAYAKLTALINNLGYQATDELLNEVIPQVLLPKQYQNLPKASLQGNGLGQVFEQEAISRLMEHVMVGALTKDNVWQAKQSQGAPTWGIATQWLPDEVQATMHLALRDISNFVGALEHYYKHRPYNKGDIKVMAYLKPMMQFANEYLDTHVKEMQEYRVLAKSMLAKLTEAGSVDWEDPVTVQSSQALDAKTLKQITSGTRYAMSVERDGAKEAKQLMFGGDKLVFEHEKRQGTTTPPWSRYAGLFFQALRRYQKSGVPLANDVMRMVNDLEPSYFRLTRNMHDPFLAYDDKGRLLYDPENPVLRLLQDSTPEAVRSRTKLNELYLWQNEHGKPIMKNGQLNPDAAQVVKEKIGGLSPTSQQAVLEGLKRLVQGYKNAADLAYGAQVEGTGARLAGVLMTIDRNMYYDRAFGQGRAVTEQAIVLQQAQNEMKRVQAKEPMLAPQAQMALQRATQAYTKSLQGLSGDQIQAIGQYMFGNDGLSQKLVDLNDFFKKREDWFGSESRPGRIFIISKTQEGENHYTSAPTEAAAKRVQKELLGEGHTDFQFIDKNQKDDYNLFNSPDAVVQNFLKLEQNAWKHFLNGMKQNIDPESYKYLEEFGYTPGEASQKYLDNKAVDRYMQKRELLPGRERLDAFETFRDYTGRMSGSVARKSLKQRLDLLKRDPRIRLDNQFKQIIDEAMTSLMTPIDDRFVAARAGMTAYFLGLPNLVGPLIEGTQSSTTILPYLVDEAGFVNGVNAYRNALVAPGKLRGLGQDLESKITLQRATMMENVDPQRMSKADATALYYRRANDEGAFQYGPIYSATLSRDHQMLTQQAFGLGKSTPKTREQLITDPLYWAAQKTMWMYSHLSAYNNRIAFLAGLDVMYDKGLRGTELYQAARSFGNLATFGGGKANGLGFVNKLSNPNTRSAFSLIESLQRYTFGQTTMFKDMLGDVLGNTGLKGEEYKHAAQALTTATLAQFMLAGALGIPGVAIGLAVMKSLTGKDPKQAMRELEVHVVKGLTDNDELATTFANYAQNGLASNFLGVDLSNRVTNNSILGFNQFDGFNANDMFGATGGLIQRMIEGTKFVAQGQMVQAGKSIAPPSWSPYFDLANSQAKYGDFALRDKSNRMIAPLSNGEAAVYALGLRPQRYRFIRDQQEAMKASNDAFAQVRDHKLDDLSSQLLQGNTRGVQDFITQLRAQDPTIPVQNTARSVIDRAVQATHPVDPLATGLVGNEAAQRQIAQSFGEVTPRQSEVADLRTREQLNARLGYMGGPPATAQAVQKAALVDSLTAKGMTRAEAVRTVEMMAKLAH